MYTYTERERHMTALTATIRNLHDAEEGINILYTLKEEGKEAALVQLQCAMDGLLEGRYAASDAYWLEGEIVCGQDVAAHKYYCNIEDEYAPIEYCELPVRAWEHEGWSYKQWDAQVKAWRAYKRLVKAM
jgi:hypothetical protein